MTAIPSPERKRFTNPSTDRLLNRLTGTDSMVGFAKNKKAELTYNKYISKIRSLSKLKESSASKISMYELCN
jgi:hypothetical protein